MQEIMTYGTDVFEKIKKIDENGLEFWSARDLQAALGYTKWDNFLNVIAKAKESCKNSDQSTNYHFADVGKMIEVAKTASREIDDTMPENLPTPKESVKKLERNETKKIGGKI